MKSCFSAALFLLIALSVRAQVRWTTTLGETTPHFGVGSLLTAPDGTAIQFGSDGFGEGGVRTAVAYGYDATGNLTVSARMPLEPKEVVGDVRAAGSPGGEMVTATFIYPADSTELRSVRLVRFAAAEFGETITELFYPANSFPRVVDLKVLSDGGILLVDEWFQNGANTARLTHYDPTGTIEWQRSFLPVGGGSHFLQELYLASNEAFFYTFVVGRTGTTFLLKIDRQTGETLAEEPLDEANFVVNLDARTAWVNAADELIFVGKPNSHHGRNRVLIRYRTDGTFAYEAFQAAMPFLTGTLRSDGADGYVFTQWIPERETETIDQHRFSFDADLELIGTSVASVGLPAPASHLRVVDRATGTHLLTHQYPTYDNARAHLHRLDGNDEPLWTAELPVTTDARHTNVLGLSLHPRGTVVSTLTSRGEQRSRRSLVLLDERGHLADRWDAEWEIRGPYPLDVASTPDGAVYELLQQSEEFVLVRHNADLTVDWSVRFPGIGGHYMRMLQVLPNGNIRCGTPSEQREYTPKGDLVRSQTPEDPAGLIISLPDGRYCEYVLVDDNASTFELELHFLHADGSLERSFEHTVNTGENAFFRTIFPHPQGVLIKYHDGAENSDFLELIDDRGERRGNWATFTEWFFVPQWENPPLVVQEGFLFGASWGFELYASENASYPVSLPTELPHLVYLRGNSVRNLVAAGSRQFGLTSRALVTGFALGGGQRADLTTESIGEMLVVPNPNTGTFRFQLPSAAGELRHYRLTDAAGRVVHAFSEKKLEETTDGRTYLVFTGGLDAGLYFLSVEDAQGRRFGGRVVVR